MELQQRPPPQMVALQSRLAALYPEWEICHMPAAALGQDAAPEDDDDALFSSFVGNAVLYGDSCQWHADADPASLPPHSPWVQQHGYYYNREPGAPPGRAALPHARPARAGSRERRPGLAPVQRPARPPRPSRPAPRLAPAGKPYFVTGLIYLNDAWAEDLHAETMFLDPATQSGVFVRPQPGRCARCSAHRPGCRPLAAAAAPSSLLTGCLLPPAPRPAPCRVVLMDQDMPHRISAPAKGTTGPRYSLVWKLVFFPKQQQQQQQEQEGQEGQEGAGVFLSRPEWGEPIRFGSAHAQQGVRAFQQQPGA